MSSRSTGQQIVATLQCIFPVAHPAWFHSMGKQVKMKTLDIWRVVNGKAVENLVQMDMLGLMQQLGVISTPGQQTP